MATATSERVIGRCLSFAKPGETFDLVTVPRRIIEPHTPLTVLPLHSPFPPTPLTAPQVVLDVRAHLRAGGGGATLPAWNDVFTRVF